MKGALNVAQDADGIPTADPEPRRTPRRRPRGVDPDTWADVLSLAPEMGQEEAERYFLGAPVDVIERKHSLDVEEAARRMRAAERAALYQSRGKTGGELFRTLPEQVPAIWGRGHAVLWMAGEALLLVGSDGVGKSTLAQQLMFAHIGVHSPEFLGWPVERATGRVLYLAMDRPQQIARSMARMVTETDYPALDERLMVHMGPLPIDPLGEPHALADWIEGYAGGGYSAVFVDSYKDLAPGLADDLPGTQLNLAMQEVLARGIEWVGLHHNRKGEGRAARSDLDISDVYGSRWITGGAGSVLVINGDAGAQNVELHHVKQPDESLGKFLVRHDRLTGRSVRVTGEMTPIAALYELGTAGGTARDVAALVYPGEDVDAVVNRVRKALDRLVDKEVARTEKGQTTASGKTGNRYWAVTP